MEIDSLKFNKEIKDHDADVDDDDDDENTSDEDDNEYKNSQIQQRKYSEDEKNKMIADAEIDVELIMNTIGNNRYFATHVYHIRKKKRFKLSYVNNF